MGTGRRFSSLFSSLSPPQSTSSQSSTSSSSTSPTTTTSRTTISKTTPSSSTPSISSPEGRGETPTLLNLMPWSPKTSTPISQRPHRRMSSSSVSPLSSSPASSSSSSLSSLPLSSSSSSIPSALLRMLLPSSLSSSLPSSLPSSSWMRSAMLIVVLILAVHTSHTAAAAAIQEPVRGRAAAGGGVVPGDAKLIKGGLGAPPLGAVPIAGDIKVNVKKQKSGLVKMDGVEADGIRAAVKKVDNQDKENRARNFKEQTFQASPNKGGDLLKQLQDHEEETKKKQEEMRKRELERQQRLTEHLQQQVAQQQKMVDEEKARREKQEQREQEQRWLVDMQKKAAEQARQQRVQETNNNQMASNNNNNNNNNANVFKNDQHSDNKNINNNNNNNAVPVPVGGANPATAKPLLHVTTQAGGVVGGRGAFVLDQNKQPVTKPVEFKAAGANNAEEVEFPRLHNRKHNKKYDVVDTINNDNIINDNDNNVNSNIKTNANGDLNSQNKNNIEVVPVAKANDNNNDNLGSFNNQNNNNNNNQFFDNNNNGQNDQSYVVKNANDNNNNNFNMNNFQVNNNNDNILHPRGDRPSMGGININWDWEDFSIMFENYGGAEMKVRRAPHATHGEPWPMPQYYSKKDNKVYKVSRDLRFMPTGHTCDILEEAMARHLQRVLRGSVEDMYDNLQHAEGTNIKDPSTKYESEDYLKAPVISRVELRVRKACSKYPTLDMDESYDLVVKKKRTFIYANEIWGLLRGLETLGQLVWKGTDGFLYIKETVVSDYPRFPHRGLHIDTSRHFLFKEVLLDIMDSMEMNKLNVFHWHIVDDQSFPYESKVYPELSRKGAYHPTYVYSLEDIAELVEYARMRGIRVLPEFDTPGHTYSWGLSRPELLTQCFSGNTPVSGYLGPMDPSKNSTYRFLTTLFQEIMDVFKDQFMHLGGDEVPLGCWQSNPEVMAFANELNRKHQAQMAKQPSLTQQNPQQNYNNYGGQWSMWSDEIKRVYEYYENRLIKLLNEIGHKRKTGVRYIMWQEVMNNNLQLPNDTIIQVWMGDMGDVMRATSLGYNVLYSTCWYLDHVEYGTKWTKYYHCDPVDQSYGYHIDEKKVLGGEAAFWSEYFSNENLIPMMWPRASAIAERLWSNKEVKNLDKAAERLSEHRCRMIKRGINAGEISGPGYCLHSPPKRRLFNDTLGCKGGNCSRVPNFVEIEDIQVHLSQRGGGLSECGKVFSHGDAGVLILLTIICFLVLFMVTVTRPSSRLGRMRHCKNRSILLVFVCLLLIYFLCYTTIGLRAFEFSGSIHKTFQEDKRGQGKDGFQDGKRILS